MQRAKEVMLCKPNKLHYTKVKTYRVISLPNCLGKVCKNVALGMLAKWCEVNHLLHSDQMRSRRQRSAINTVARMVNRVLEA